MEGIKLDPSKLLGFKIIANDGSGAVLHSPKIGGKGCTNVDVEAWTAGATFGAKVGTKTGIKTS